VFKFDQNQCSNYPEYATSPFDVLRKRYEKIMIINIQVVVPTLTKLLDKTILYLVLIPYSMALNKLSTY